MNAPPCRVSCLIVTYADRRALLGSVIQRLHEMSAQIDGVVIVFNGVPYDVDEFVANNTGPVTLHAVVLSSNTGSAEGYATALDSATKLTSNGYFWLLDDDNQPELNALDMLFSASRLLGPSPDVLLLSLRADRWEYLVAVHTGQHPGFRKNAFFNFHTGEIIRRKLCGWRPFKERVGELPRYPLVCVPYAPYGGLMLHRTWIDRVGLPRRDYFLYGDDHEYTDRISRAGGRVYLCASSHIRDIDRSWFLTGNARCHFLLDPDASALRAYFGLRNRVATERQGHVSSSTLYVLNALVFATRNLLGAYRYWFNKRFWRRVSLLISAAREGWSGQLRPMDASLKEWIERHA